MNGHVSRHWKWTKGCLLEIYIMINDKDLKNWHRCWKTAQESNYLWANSFLTAAPGREEWQRRPWEVSRWLLRFRGGEMISYHLKAMRTGSWIFHFNILLGVQNTKPLTRIRIPRSRSQAAAQIQTRVFWARWEDRVLRTPTQSLCII